MNGDVLLRVAGVSKVYGERPGQMLARSRGGVRAVDNVTLEVRRGETLSLVGETGCGKTTLARCILRLTDVTSGAIHFDGVELTRMSRRELRPVRRRIQAVFQDPYGSLNPRHSVGAIIGEPLAVHELGTPGERARRVAELMELVGLDPAHHRRRPGEFSGGQRQRVCIARALALSPDLVVCDEPVSALDVSIRAQILNLLVDLQGQLGLTYLIISHDLSVVRHVSDRVAVMYLGRIVEVAPAASLFAQPRHHYTRALLDAVPPPDPDTAPASIEASLAGDPPSPLDPPSGCRFHPRCPRVQAACVSDEPVLSLESAATARAVACHFPLALPD